MDKDKFIKKWELCGPDFKKDVEALLAHERRAYARAFGAGMAMTAQAPPSQLRYYDMGYWSPYYGGLYLRDYYDRLIMGDYNVRYGHR